MTATATPTETPTPTPTGPMTLVLGQEVRSTTPGLNGGQYDYRVTVHAVQDPTAQDAPEPQPGARWMAADTQYCLDGAPPDGVTLSWYPWNVVGADGGSYPASNTTYSSFPIPEYPVGGKPLAVGECVRGWIVFPVTNGVTVDFVRYAPDGAEPVRWAAQ